MRIHPVELGLRLFIWFFLWFRILIEGAARALVRLRMCRLKQPWLFAFVSSTFFILAGSFLHFYRYGMAIGEHCYSLLKYHSFIRSLVHSFISS